MNALLVVITVMPTQLAPTQLDLSHVHAMLGITEMAHLAQVSFLFKFLLIPSVDKCCFITAKVYLRVHPLELLQRGPCRSPCLQLGFSRFRFSHNIQSPVCLPLSKSS